MTQTPGETGAASVTATTSSHSTRVAAVMKRHSRSRTALSIALLSLALVALDASRAVAGGGSCSLDPNTHVATVSPIDHEGFFVNQTVVRSGDNVLVNGNACGTVTTIDKMVFNLNPATVRVTFDLGGGPFEPGYVSHSGDTGEMEFEVHFDDRYRQWIEILGSSGDDFIKTGEDLDFVVGDDAGGGDGNVFSVVNLNAATDQDSDIWISGSVYAYLIEGLSGNDQIDGSGLGGGGPFDFSRPTTLFMEVRDGDGNDTITGGSGFNRFYADDRVNGRDTYVGGAGLDAVYYGWRTKALMVTLDGVANDGQSCPGDSCERDNIDSDIDEVTGGSASDRLVGGPGPQHLYGNEGHNFLRGLGGNDLLSAGLGNDDFRGGGGFDTVRPTYGSAGISGIEVTIDDKPGDGVPGEHDNVHTDVEGLEGTSYTDRLIGSNKANKLYGNSGDDVLKGGPGNDTLRGGGTSPSSGNDGNDTYFGGSGRDTVQFDIYDPYNESEGLIVTLDDVANDRVTNSSVVGVDNVRSDVDNVVGTTAPDTLVGSAANNRLVGRAGNDTLKGLGGNDTLVGGPDDDALLGGAGTDSYQQGDGTGTTNGCE